MRLMKTVMVTLAGLVMMSSQVFADASNGNYKIDLDLPEAFGWRLISNQQDTAGYTKLYLASANNYSQNQRLLVSFQLGYKKRVRTGMLDILKQHQKTGCRDSTSRLISINQDTILFSTRLAQCPDGKVLWQIFKSFNRADGQYTVAYAADMNKVPQNAIDAMDKTVQEASIVRNNDQ